MSTLLASNRSTRLALIAIFLSALAFRLIWIVAIEPRPKLEGGDGPYYLALGRSLAGLEVVEAGWSAAVGPMYPFYLSVFYRLLPEAWVIPAARMGQATLDTLTCVLAFELGRRIFGARAGWLAAGALAIDLRFVTQAGAINTETLFIFFLVAGVTLFAVARERGGAIRYAGFATLLLLAAFTRPIALPLPILLAGSLLLPRPTLAQWKVASAVAGLAAGIVGGWSIRQHQLTGQWVIISDGLTGNFWLGSWGEGDWKGAAAFQTALDEMKNRYDGRPAYLEDAFRIIASDPLAYGGLLIRKLARAYTQPYGTAAFPGESLKDLAVGVLRGQLSLGELIGGEAFWPKLYIYVFHFASLSGGLIGAWLARREWLKTLPLTLPILFFTIGYTLLTIIPRYLFPIMPFYTVLAAYAAARLVKRRG